ncbi:hypothetical protein [Trichococcus shcherbakoviae]|uniref:hypothetical protein n=1 Tax=Trichococcus shcherbakoviae TaxID=2094020 RepID=UPI002AA62E5B|nr:hypothetical protein [Trichococcus shcherbakoviae]
MIENLLLLITSLGMLTTFVSLAVGAETRDCETLVFRGVAFGGLLVVFGSVGSIVLQITQ